MDKLSSQFDENPNENEPSCSIAAFDAGVIVGLQIRMPLDVLSRMKSLGEENNLHYISLFDIFGHIIFERRQCEDLRDELLLLKKVTNDKWLNRYVEDFLQLITSCIGKNCRLLVNGD